jgi:glycosyltransferase involved in cell wall biosynthesis
MAFEPLTAIDPLPAGDMLKVVTKPASSLKLTFLFYDSPNYTGGPKVNACRLLPELVNRGYQVTALISYTTACPSRKFLEDRGVEVRAVVWPLFVEDQLQWLYEQLADIGPDVFVPGCSVSGCYAGRYLREAGRPTIASHRSVDEFNWGLAERFCKNEDEWAVSGLFCVSERLTDAVRRWKPHRTIVHTIPSGVPLPSRTADPSGPLRLVYAGRLEQHPKRILDLISGIMDAMRRDPQLTAKLVGDGSQRAVLEQQITASPYAHRFGVTGLVPPEKLQDELLDRNVFVLVSDFEGVPGAVMDAMACGLVPVCLDAPGGLRELVIHEETGLLINDRGKSLHDAIERLAADADLRHRLSANARKHIEKGFSIEVTVARWEQLFSEVLAAAGPRRAIRFPQKPVLPPPYASIARDDTRRPSKYTQALHACAGLPRRSARWVHRHLFGMEL